MKKIQSQNVSSDRKELLARTPLTELKKMIAREFKQFKKQYSPNALVKNFKEIYKANAEDRKIAESLEDSDIEKSVYIREYLLDKNCWMLESIKNQN